MLLGSPPFFFATTEQTRRVFLFSPFHEARSWNGVNGVTSVLPYGRQGISADQTLCECVELSSRMPVRSSERSLKSSETTMKNSASREMEGVKLPWMLLLMDCCLNTMGLC